MIQELKPELASCKALPEADEILGCTGSASWSLTNKHLGNIYVNTVHRKGKCQYAHAAGQSETYSSQAGFYILQNYRSIIIFPMLGEFPQSKTRSITPVELRLETSHVCKDGRKPGRSLFLLQRHSLFPWSLSSPHWPASLYWAKFWTPSKYQFIIDTIQDASMTLKWCSRNCCDIALCVSSVLLFKSCSCSGQNCFWHCLRHRASS